MAFSSPCYMSTNDARPLAGIEPHSPRPSFNLILQQSTEIAIIGSPPSRQKSKLTDGGDCCTQGM